MTLGFGELDETKSVGLVQEMQVDEEEIVKPSSVSGSTDDDEAMKVSPRSTDTPMTDVGENKRAPLVTASIEVLLKHAKKGNFVVVDIGE